MIYVNGYLDAVGYSREPYQGNSGSVNNQKLLVDVFVYSSSLIIGARYDGTVADFFDGCLDSIEYTDRVKNASEILIEATLVAHLSFDEKNLLDSGPLLINGTGFNYQFTSVGRVRNTLELSGNLSYVQISGLRRLGTTGWPYTVAIWIKPSDLTGATIMHFSVFLNGSSSWCLATMKLTASGQIVINSYNGSLISLFGPYATLNQWTHVAMTYSTINGLRLFIDGFQHGSSSLPFTYKTESLPMVITLGSSLLGFGYCGGAPMPISQYQGYLDEFRVYARELTPKEVWTLANP